MDNVFQLLMAYYAWDLSYPKQFQLLGFMQQFVLNDTATAFFKGSNYIKMEKQMNAMMKKSTLNN